MKVRTGALPNGRHGPTHLSTAANAHIITSNLRKICGINKVSLVYGIIHRNKLKLNSIRNIIIVFFIRTAYISYREFRENFLLLHFSHPFPSFACASKASWFSHFCECFPGLPLCLQPILLTFAWHFKFFSCFLIDCFAILFDLPSTFLSTVRNSRYFCANVLIAYTYRFIMYI